MKILIPLLLTYLSVAAATLWCDYDGVITPSLAIHFRQSQDVTQPLTNWQAVGTITNVQPFSNNVQVTLTSPQMFFVAIASNEWGIMATDVLTSVPPSKAKIKITKP